MQKMSTQWNQQLGRYVFSKLPGLNVLFGKIKYRMNTKHSKTNLLQKIIKCKASEYSTKYSNMFVDTKRRMFGNINRYG